MSKLISDYLKFKDSITQAKKSKEGLNELVALKKSALINKEPLNYYMLCKALNDVEGDFFDDYLFNRGELIEKEIRESISIYEKKNLYAEYDYYKQFFEELNEIITSIRKEYHPVVLKINLVKKYFPLKAKNLGLNKYLKLPYFIFNKRVWPKLIEDITEEFKKLKESKKDL